MFGTTRYTLSKLCFTSIIGKIVINSSTLIFVSLSSGDVGHSIKRGTDIPIDSTYLASSYAKSIETVKQNGSYG